jgi:tetratricopeptide (TPR) repeat protein
MPDHIGANNDLGYFWANAGIRLDQAEPMIKKAVENKPDDPAFIDSLGWLYYKQGKFADARLQLERAISLPGGASAEGIQHLGDTLYRLGKTQEAIDRWAQAREMLGSPDKLSPDDKKESQYLSAALAAARAGKEPALSPLADSPGTKAAGPAGTMPK